MGGRGRAPARAGRVAFARHGRGTAPFPEEQLATARAAFEDGTDFTVAVEEEFALLDPETLGLVNRFEEVQGGRGRHRARAAPRRRADRLRGRGAHRQVRRLRRGGRDDGRAPRASCRRSRASSGSQLGATGTHPWSRWQDQRIIDTPHYRRNDELLRYVVWRNNTFGLHVHVGIRGGDRAIAVCNALRSFLPELLALSASSPFVEEVDSGLHSARTQIFTRMFPRCGIPDAYDGWQGFEDYVSFLYRTGSIDEHTQLWWSVRPHLAYPTVEIRICDAQPDLGEAQASRRSPTRSPRAARAPSTRASRCPTCRTGCSRRTSGGRSAAGSPGELIDFERGEPVPRAPGSSS